MISESTTLQTHSFTDKETEVTSPSEVSRESAKKTEAFPSHTTYYPDPNMSSLLAGDVLMPNKEDAPSLALRELKGLKASLSASDTFFSINYVCPDSIFTRVQTPKMRNSFGSRSINTKRHTDFCSQVPSDYAKRERETERGHQI